MGIETLYDTIVAPATPLLPSPIGIVRISGEKTQYILENITKSSKVTQNPSRAILSRIFDEDGRELDEVIVIFYKSPYSYTGEDMAELFLHGNPLLLDRVIELCVKLGARVALPGEFTKRAYLNGKISLEKAEAINSIINSATIEGIKRSVKVLKGGFEEIMKKIKEEIIEITAELTASIDFPEDVDPELPHHKLLEDISSLSERVEKLVGSWTKSKILLEGSTCVIIGKPNAGKSTLFNSLVGESRAITSPIPGTTRDYIDMKINIGGAIITLIDTAGIRESADPIEEEGIKRALELTERSDILVSVFDSSTEFDKDDEKILKVSENSKANLKIIAINKIDIGDAKAWRKILSDRVKMGENFRVIEISAKFGVFTEVIKEIIREFILSSADQDENISITSLRQKNLLEEILANIKKSVSFIKNSDYLGATLSLQASLSKIDDILGIGSSEEVINSVFERFCIGK